MVAVDEQERLLRNVRPGDVYSFDVDPDDAPCLGDRLSLVTVSREGTQGRLETGLVQDDNGPWEVIRVGSSGSTSNRAKVLIRRL